MLRKLLLALALLFPVAANAAVGTIYIDTGGATTNSGTTDSNTVTATGTAMNITGGTGTASVDLDTNTNLVSCATGCPVAQDSSQAIYLANATNTNIKIFWIDSFTGCTGTGACTLTLSAAGTGAGKNAALPTCTTCNTGNWTIGGRMVLTPANYESAVRPGDTVQFNNSPTCASVCFSVRVAGDDVTGRIRIIGKTGTRPVLLATNVPAIQNASGLSSIYIENLELKVSSASAFIPLNLSNGGNNIIVNNIKATQSGTGGPCVSIGGQVTIMFSEITGCSTTGISGSPTPEPVLFGNYIHGNGTDGVSISTPTAVAIMSNVISNNGGRGINLPSVVQALNNVSQITGNTIYGNANSQIEVADVDWIMLLANNILEATTTGVATLKYTAGTGDIVLNHLYNVYWNSADSNSGLSAVTANSTEVVADPLMTNPASGDFSLQASSPARNAGFPGQIIGISNNAFRAIGAAQPQSTSASGGFIIGGG